MKSTIKLPFNGKRNRFSFNSNHETTLNFGSFLPAYCRDLAPNETLSVDTRMFARVAPMLVPTFGDVRMKLHAYFVPYSAVWDYFNDFIDARITPTPDNEVFVTFERVPLIENETFVEILAGGLGFSTNGTSEIYDFMINQNDEIAYRVFSRQGKVIYQILQSLGYNIRFDDAEESLYFNALPLLCFFKLFFEHFIPQQYKPGNKWRNFTQYLHDYIPTDGSSVIISVDWLTDLLSDFTLAYKQDYFTSMWSDPNQIIQNLVTSEEKYFTTDVKGQKDSEESSYLGSIDVSEGEPSVDVDTRISPWAISLAQKVASWLTRMNLVGSDHANRILAEFGIKPIDSLGVVKYCGSYETQLKIDSVFDTAGIAENAPLGSYAGRGFITGSSPKFEVTTKEHGLFMICVTVQPVATYTDGVDRHLLYREREDFFSPTFDGVGMQATPVCEVFNSFIMRDEDRFIGEYGFKRPFRILGFNPRYAERKYDKCRVTGDFNIHTLYESVAPYSLQRNVFVDKFSIIRGLNSKVTGVFDLSDIVFQRDAAQYNRIFADTTGRPDPIFALFDFNVKLISPMLQISDSFEQFEDGKQIDVTKNGGFTN